MESMENGVVFRKGEKEDDNDIWDDTALIKAYDAAVSQVKKEISKKIESEDKEKSDISTSVGNVKETDAVHNKKKKNKKHKQRKNSNEWKEGDLCRAVYTEDNLVYDAKIIRTTSHGTCIVRYLGYNNEEEKYFSDLIPTSKDHAESACSAAESDMDWTRQSPRDSGRSSYNQPSPHPYTNPAHTPFFHPPVSQMFSPAGGMFPPAGGMFPSAGGMFPPAGYSPMRIPLVPPPPPIHEDIINGDNEAMCSMLMSWYMSGYHTGYYQGLKEGKSNQKKSNPNEPTPDTTTQQE